MPLPTRTGGFGGVVGLAQYLASQQITHVVDATHPFAAQISQNAIAACRQARIPLIALTRPPWSLTPNDQWTRVTNYKAAVKLLTGSARRVWLAIGRTNLQAFSQHQQHYYLLRITEQTSSEPPFRNCQVLTARGPFTKAADATLLREHRIDLIVAKNSGGTGAQSKILAARDLKIPIIMIDRPQIEERPQTYNLQEVIHWLSCEPTDLGV